MGITKRQLGDAILQTKRYVDSKIPSDWKEFATSGAISKETSEQKVTVSTTLPEEENVADVLVVVTVSDTADTVFTGYYPWFVIYAASPENMPTIMIPASNGMVATVKWADGAKVEIAVANWPETEHDDDRVTVTMYYR